MSEEEKKAVEILNSWYSYNKKNRNKLLEADKIIKVQETILNLIENQQKELDNLKEIEQSHQEENGLLRQELDMQIEHNKELEATLKQTQDSWFEDTQKLEQEKEKNKELEEKLKMAKQLYNDACICIATDCIEKSKIKEMMKYREFELQQEYKEFEEDVEWRTYKKILEDK